MYGHLWFEWGFRSVGTCWNNGERLVSISSLTIALNCCCSKGVVGFFFYGYAIARDFSSGKKYVKNYYQNYRPEEIETERLFDLGDMGRPHPNTTTEERNPLAPPSSPERPRRRVA